MSNEVVTLRSSNDIENSAAHSSEAQDLFKALTELKAVLETTPSINQAVSLLPQLTASINATIIQLKSIEPPKPKEIIPEKAAIETPPSSPDPSGPPARPSASDLDEKRRQLEERRKMMEQEKREVAAQKKKMEVEAEKKLKEEEAERQAQAKARAETERREKLEEIIRVHKEKVSLAGGRRASAICRDLQGYRISKFTSSGEAQSVSFGGAKEFAIFFNIINQVLAAEPDFQPLPLYGQENKNFDELSDGSIVCRFINKIKDGAIDSKLIRKQSKIPNWALCLTFLESCGVICLEDPAQLAAGSLDSLLKVIWEVIKIFFESEIKKLTKTLDELFLSVNDPIEKILAEWVNLLVPSETPATNITSDFQNSFFYLHLCHILLGSSIDTVSEQDEVKKAHSVVAFLDDLELGPLITPDAILKGTYWTNFICLCKLFLHTNA